MNNNYLTVRFQNDGSEKLFPFLNLFRWVFL